MASKYLKLYQEMTESHKDLFDSFKKVHDAYSEDQESNKEAFNRIGAEVLKVMRTYESMLTSEMNSSGYSRFATGLSDKFRDVVRKEYPMIDFVGVK